MKYFTAVLVALRCVAKVLGVTGTSAVWAFLFYWSGIAASKVDIVTSHETTRVITSPRADGTIDYIAHLDAVLRDGVTPENNAMPLLLAAIGPGAINDDTAPLICERLGMPPLPLKGEYLITMDVIYQAITEPAEAAKQTIGGVAIDIARIERLVPADLRERIRSDFELARAARAEFAATSRALTTEEAFGPNAVSLPAGPKPPELPYEFCNRMRIEGMAAPWNATTHPLLEAWLLVNDVPRQLVEDASRRPRYYWPLVAGDGASEGLFQAAWAPVGLMREAARLFTCRAMRQVDAGDFEAAWADLATAYRLARLCGQHPFVIAQLVAVSIDTMADHCLLALAAGDQLPAPLARQWAARRLNLAAPADLARAMDLGDRYAMLDVIALMSSDIFDVMRWGGCGGMKSNELSRWFSNRLFDPNHAMRRVNLYLDSMVEALGHDDYAIIASRVQETARVRERTDGSIDFRGDPLPGILTAVKSTPARRRERFTDLLSGFISSSLPRADEVRGVFIGEATGDLAVVALLLRAHRAEQGEYPARLSELSDAGFAIPRDRFDNEPLRYRRTSAGYVLYSVGGNLTDDGGQHKVGNDWFVDIVAETFEGRRVADE